MRSVRSGVIGTGFAGAAHIEAVRRLGYVEVVALAEKDQELAARKAADLSIPRAYGNYQDLLNDEEIDVVHVCTPNNTHYEVTKAALEAGKHVLSEKPLAMDSHESAELVKLAMEKGVVSAINFNYRQYPMVREIRAMIRQSELGKINLVHGSYLQDWLLYETDYNWRIEPDVGGKSRAVADIGSHWCETVQYATGLKIAEVFAELRTVIPVRKKGQVAVETFVELGEGDYEEKPVTTEDYAAVLLRFSNGASGVFTVSQVSPGRKNKLYFEVDGSKKAVAWDQEEPCRLWIGCRDSANEELLKDPNLLHKEARGYAHYPGGHNEGWPDGLKNLMADFYGFIREGKDPSGDPADFPTFRDGHHEMLLVRAILESYKKQKWARVEYGL